MQLYSCTKGHNLQGWPSQSILIHEWEQITFVLMSRVLVTDEKMCVPAMHLCIYAKVEHEIKTNGNLKSYSHLLGHLRK